jgi:NADH-quinone oxidoreductase subunit C
VPDATSLELIAGELRVHHGDDVVGTTYHRGGRAEVEVKAPALHFTIEHLRTKGYTMVMSIHGCDYWPEEPRLGVLYELLDMSKVDRLTVKVRVTAEDPHVASIVDLFPGADFDERETYDMFGVIFDGHPDLRRILMPEDYEGYPQRRDFPVGGEPVLFTYNEAQGYGKNQ